MNQTIQERERSTGHSIVEKRNRFWQSMGTP
jgi:hypothetical protein